MEIRSIDPATGDLLKVFTAADVDDVSRSVERARSARSTWDGLSAAQQESCFAELAATMQADATNILDSIRLETGKLRADGEAELYDVIDAVAYYVGKQQSLGRDSHLALNSEAFPDTEVSISYAPYGVIALIMPWNFPFYSPMMFILAALAAGNAVVLKPSEHSTIVGLLIQDIFRRANFPDGLVEVVVGAEDTGRFLVRSGVDKVFFVGSVEAGKEVIASAGTTPVQVELGGNSAAIVLADADLELAAQGIAWGGTYHSGQDCVGIKRVIVVREVAQPLIGRLVEIVSQLRPSVDYGPYITRDAMLTTRTRIDDAVANGAKLLCGAEPVFGLPGDGNWLTPSVVIIDDWQNPLVSEETFGNTLPVLIVNDEDEAVRQANNTVYGLSNAVFTRNVAAARAIADKLQSGMVFINDPFVAFPGWDHWTGWKHSGFGTVESKFDQCLKKKVVSTNREGHKRGFWYPYPDPAAS